MQIQELTSTEKTIFLAILQAKKDPNHWTNDFGQLDEETQLKYRKSIDPLIEKGYIYLHHELIESYIKNHVRSEIKTSIRLTGAGRGYVKTLNPQRKKTYNN